MRKTTTVYMCDSCGKKVDRQKDLQRFTVTAGRLYKSAAHSAVDVCDECEAKLLAALEPFFANDEARELLEMRRDD